MLLHALDRYRDAGLLILRVGIGLAFALGHGGPKLFGGPERWRGVGGAAANVGLDFAPVFWGFMAAFAEFGGGILLILGLLFRPAAFLLLCTMIVAAVSHATGAIPGSPLHAVEAGVVFLALIFIGPGTYSLDARLSGNRRRGF